MILNNRTISLTFLKHLLTCGSSQSGLFGAFHHFTSKKKKKKKIYNGQNVVKMLYFALF